MAERILVVDDDPVQRRLLDTMISRMGYETVVVEGGDAAAAMLTAPDAARIDAVVLDLVMPDLDGLGVMAKMREAGLTIPIIVQTAHGGIDTVVNAMRAGATDFVVKPVGAERLQVCLRNALATSALKGELLRLKRSRTGTLTFTDIITKSPRMQSVLHTAQKAAGSAIPVLIEGQSGVGKELIARAIHGTGERRAKPFVAVNCGAIPDNLVESILFGHEKGSFTGATERHSGKFVEASGGTLFLDEVGELPPAAQIKLLRAIQEGEVEPVGARRPVKIDARIVSATNRNLMSDVSAGRFREDLFYRLHVYPLTVPPLIERREDIPDLARHFLARFAAEEGKRITRISRDALDLLVNFRWPGNVRQLENAVFRAVVLADSDELGVVEFPQIASPMANRAQLLPDAPTATVEVDPPVVPSMSADSQPILHGTSPPHMSALGQTALALLDDGGEVRTIEDIENELIRYAILHYRGQMSEVARRLKIGRSTLYRKLDALGLEHDNSAEPAARDVVAG